MNNQIINIINNDWVQIGAITIVFILIYDVIIKGHNNLNKK
jgi:hypothetical protein